MKRILLWLIPFYAVLLAGFFVGGLWLSPQILPKIATIDELQILKPFGEAWKLVDRQFYGSLPTPEVRLRGAIRGILETLNDPYTILLEPQPAQQELQKLAGRYGDIGVSLWWTPEGGIGLSPYPNGPAENAGIREGDCLLAVNGESVAGILNLDQLAWQLQGEVSTTVTLTLLRPPTPLFTITVERDSVLHPSIQWRMLDAPTGIGYVHIAIFTDQTGLEVGEALSKMKSLGLRALVLDLRDNGGGVIAPLPVAASAFVPKGTPLYYEVEQQGERAVEAVGDTLFDSPLAILVNGGTASASEIFAAALQENGRAILVGSPTFGKGSIQALFPLQDGSTLHITNAVWLTPQHHRLDGVGLQPDLPVESIEGRDAMLDAAVDYLYDAIQ